MARVARSCPTDIDLLESIPVSVLAFDRDRCCRSANLSARQVFSSFDPVGLGMSALFAEWVAPPHLSSIVDGNVKPTLSTHADGRVFTTTATDLPDGGFCLALVDVSAHLSGVERAARDNLTGLMQRAALKDRLSEIVAHGTRDGAGAAVHFIDLDRFKGINDSLGHSIGDGLLAKVAERLRSVVQKGDAVARLGGDEFVIVQAVTDTPESAQALATRVIDLVSRTYILQGHMVNIGASVGIAMFPADGSDAETLLRHADLALYKSKADGRGISRFFEASMNARMQARRLLEADIRRALALRQFRLNFQPLVQLSSNKISGFEALLRWQHPERGLISPCDFIPLAEEIGLIVPIGEWVLRTACRQAAGWSVPATVAVNISPVQFKGGKLVETIVSALAQSGLAPDRLEIEITEGALLDETNLVLSALHAVRALGVKVSMDDFGTGYSSLSYLRKFPFDKLKIDQSFVKGLGGSADCDAIVRAVANLGASLGMRTTAEGVETSEQLDRIRNEGCTEVQGYFTGRPLEASDVAALLDQQSRG